MRKITIPVMFLLGALAFGQGGTEPMGNNPPLPEGMAEAILGGGCFWCVEAVYERIDGVQEVYSGYAGGTLSNPSYRQVTSGTSGHAEVVRIVYDPQILSYEEILEWFWKAHDPTTLNRQGADVGTHYRSIILYGSEDERVLAMESMEAASELYINPIVTQLVPLEAFYIAEDYHQDYFEKNPEAGYCRVVIQPKLEKLGLDGVF